MSRYSSTHLVRSSTVAIALGTIVGIGTAAHAQPAEPESHQHIRSKAIIDTNAIVQVELDGAIGTGVIICLDKTTPVGDGFAGFCLTAEHVVAGDDGRRKIRVRYQNGRVAKRCKVITADSENDVALLWVWVPEGIRPAPVAKRPAGRQQDVHFAGLGGGANVECCIRQFSAKTAPPTTADKIFAPASLLPGDSGGPVFNRDGEVLGVISGGWLWYAPDKNEPLIGHRRQATWPARACNVAALRRLVADAVVCLEHGDNDSSDVEPELASAE